MDPSPISQEVFSRIRDFADAVLLLVSAGQFVAIWKMWTRLGTLVDLLVVAHGLRVEDGKKNSEAVLSALGAARETISSQVGVTEKLRDTIERLREASESLRTNLDRIWQAFDALRDRQR